MVPLLRQDDDRFGQNLRVVFRQQIQPWHPTSTLTHEAAAAVLRLTPTKFWDFAAVMFKHQENFFDEAVKDEGRNATYDRLAALAVEAITRTETRETADGETKKDESENGQGMGKSRDDIKSSIDRNQIMDLLKIGTHGSNAGNKVTADVKLMVKAARVAGVHISPTVFFDGVEEKGISSSFTSDQWKDWLERNVLEI